MELVVIGLLVTLSTALGFTLGVVAVHLQMSRRRRELMRRWQAIGSQRRAQQRNQGQGKPFLRSVPVNHLHDHQRLN